MRGRVLCSGRTVLLFVCLALVLSIVSGCGNSANTVKIGAVYPLTGAQASAGEAIRNSILLAVDIINNQHDLDLPLARSAGLDRLGGARVEVIFADSASVASEGQAAAQRLLAENRVHALLGSYQSAVTAAASEVAEEKGIPFLAPEASAPSLTRRGFRWFFRTTPNEETFVESFFDFFEDIQRESGIMVQSLAILAEDSIFGSEVAALARERAQQRGLQVVEEIVYPADITDVGAQVLRLKAAAPDVVLQASFVNDAILFMQTYKELGFRPDAILADNAGFIDPEFLRVLGADANYVLTRETWAKDLAGHNPLVGVVNQMYRERYGMDMDGSSARAFTGMLVLADAINRAGTTAPEAIRAALLATDIPGEETIMPWDGVRFDPDTHQNTLGRGIISQIVDLEYHTVWPPDLATSQLIWPMPR
jgi:branched-chain amino acid transport system substrate-binding protein